MGLCLQVANNFTFNAMKTWDSKRLEEYKNVETMTEELMKDLFKFNKDWYDLNVAPFHPIAPPPPPTRTDYGGGKVQGGKDKGLALNMGGGGKGKGKDWVYSQPLAGSAYQGYSVQQQNYLGRWTGEGRFFFFNASDKQDHPLLSGKGSGKGDKGGAGKSGLGKGSPYGYGAGQSYYGAPGDYGGGLPMGQVPGAGAGQPEAKRQRLERAEAELAAAKAGA